MHSTHRSQMQNLRIIWAITAKDLLDGFKNKTILISILSVVFLILIYRYLPVLESGDTLPRIVIYDQGNSTLTARLEDNLNFDLRSVSSRQELNAYLGGMDFVTLGVVLPADFDQRMASQAVELEGYVIHWASKAQADEVRAFFEQQLGEIAGTPVRIHIEGNRVYTQATSHGLAFLAAVSLILSITMFGISVVPNLILEEKQTRTLDAMLVSPANRSHVVISKALTGMVYCLAAAAAVYAIYWTIVTHWWLAILAAICGSLLTVSLGLFLGSLFQVRQQLTLWAWFLLVPLLIPLFLSNLKDLLPQRVSYLLNWIPTVALSRAIRASFSEQISLAAFGPELALVLGSAILVLAAVTWLLRRSES